jgi:hypothetical protein
MPEYSKLEYRKFAEDMNAAGLEVLDYRGRNFYSGPAVAVDDIQDSLSKTTVKCQWDQLGQGFIVYPR